METDDIMNAPAKMILAIALLAGTVVILLFGGELMARQALVTASAGTGATGGAGLNDFGGYLVLMLLNIGLATVVAWMLFGRRK